MAGAVVSEPFRIRLARGAPKRRWKIEGSGRSDYLGTADRQSHEGARPQAAAGRNAVRRSGPPNDAEGNRRTAQVVGARNDNAMRTWRSRL